MKVAAGEIFEMLDYFQHVKVDKSCFIEDLQKLAPDTILFIYQGLVYRDDYIRKLEEQLP